MKSDEHTIPPRRETEKTGRYRAASDYGDTTPQFLAARVRSLTTAGCEPSFTAGCYHINY